MELFAGKPLLGPDGSECDAKKALEGKVRLAVRARPYEQRVNLLLYSKPRMTAYVTIKKMLYS